MTDEPGRGIGRGGPSMAATRYQTLDTWRGLACLMVVVHHAGYALALDEVGESWGRWLAWALVRRGSLGVSLFFVISGYCIAASAEASARRGEGAGAFLRRRAWRIYPPYWAALLGLVALIAALDAARLGRLYRGPLAVVLDPPGALDWRQWLGNLTLTETWRERLGGPVRNVFTGVAWSLCYEEQFYLVCALVLALAPSRLVAGLAALTAGLVGVRAYAWWVGGLDAFGGTFPLLWHEFAAGLAVYYRLHRADRAWQKRLAELALAAMLACGWSSDGRSTATAAGFGLVLVALRRWDAAAASAAWLGPLRACGQRCYSIYLAHLPLGVVGNQWLYERGLTSFWTRALVMVPLASIAGIAAGWAFHAAVEARFLGPPPPLARSIAARLPWRRRGPGLAGVTAAD